jgi:Amt family ammonium transporter
MTFAIITPALIAGAFAERMKFSAMLWFIGLWAIFVYAPIAHWVWGPDGFLASGNDAAWVKVLDFAGGTVVHINAGVAGLMCAIMLGKRSETGPAHNVVLTFIGAALLWVGWFGFNAGSAVTAGMQAGMAMLVTPDCHGRRCLHLDAGEWSLKASQPSSASARVRSPALLPLHQLPVSWDPSGLCNRNWRGCLLLLGMHRLEAHVRYDDALDCFGVHAIGGIVGALLTGVFAVEQYGGTAGVLEGNRWSVPQSVHRGRHRLRL